MGHTTAGHVQFNIGSREVGPGRPCLIIGEVALSHDGSLGQAHAFIDAIASAGADAVKFQTHLAAAESTLAEPWRVPFSPADETRYAYWKRTEFTEAQWIGLRQHAEVRGLIFLSSPFALEAVDLLQRVGVPAWKIASGEVGNLTLLERVVATRLPILLSSGMSPWSELDAAVASVVAQEVPFAVLQCTSLYPCPPEKVGLNVLDELRSRYRCPVGFSDHSGTIFPALAAAAIGLELLEIHVTLSREMFGPDVSASITTSELRQLIQGIRTIETIKAHPVDKDAMAEALRSLRTIFTRSIVATTDLYAGTQLFEKHLAVKKPGTGIPATRLRDVIGRRLRRDVKADELIQLGDLV